MNAIRTVYIPVFDRAWKVLPIETQEARFIAGKVYSDSIIYCGTIYNGENLFSSEEGAVAWIQKNYHEARKHQVNSNDCIWKEVR